MISLAFYFICNGTLIRNSNPRKFYVSEHRHLKGCKTLALGTTNWMDFRNEDSKLCSYRKSYNYEAGFLNSSTIGILSWMIFCCGRQSCTCGVFSRIPGYTLNANSTPQLWQTRMVPDIARYILEWGGLF